MSTCKLNLNVNDLKGQIFGQAGEESNEVLNWKLQYITRECE